MLGCLFYARHHAIVSTHRSGRVKSTPSGAAPALAAAAAAAAPAAAASPPQGGGGEGEADGGGRRRGGERREKRAPLDRSLLKGVAANSLGGVQLLLLESDELRVESDEAANTQHARTRTHTHRPTLTHTHTTHTHTHTHDEPQTPLEENMAKF